VGGLCYGGCGEVFWRHTTWVKGLIDAYNSVARKTLEQASKGTVVHQCRALLQLDYEAYGKLYEDLARLVSEPEALFQEQVIMQGWVDVARKDDVEQLAAKGNMSLQWEKKKG